MYPQKSYKLFKLDLAIIWPRGLLTSVYTRVIQNLKGHTDRILTRYLRQKMTIGYMLGKLKELGFDSREDFIRFNFHLLSDNERKLAALVGLTKPDKDG